MKRINRMLILTVCAGLLATTADAQLRYGKLGVGPMGSAYIPTIDNLSTAANTGSPGMGGGLSVVYCPWEYIGMKAIVGVGQFTYKFGTTASTTTMATLNGYATLNLMPNSSFNPFIGGGVGYHYSDARSDLGAALVGAGSTRSDISILATGGFDIFFSEFLSVTASADYAIMGTDWIDGTKTGGNNDGYIRAGLEIRYYFFDQAFLTRLLEALKKRYEK